MRNHLLPALAALGLLLLFAAVAAFRRSPQKEFDYWMAIGRGSANQKLYADAVAHFQNAARLFPGNAEPLYRQALAHQAAERLRDAHAAATMAANLDSRHRPAHLLQARLAVQAGRKSDVEDARKRLHRMLAASPADADARLLLAAAEMRLGAPARAGDLIEESLRRNPTHLPSWLALAEVRVTERNYAAAEQVLRDALASVPGSPALLAPLGQLYLFLGRPRDAEARLLETLQLHPANGPALLGLAAVRMREGDLEQAQRIYRQASALPDRRYRHLYARFLLQMGHFDEAITELRECARKDSGDRNLRGELVTAYVSANRFGEAHQLLTRALASNPSDLQALWQRAAVFFAAGELAPAEDLLEKALNQEPTFAEARHLLARLHAARNSPMLERQELTEVLRLKRDYLPARVDLSRAWFAAGDPKAALEVLESTPAALQSWPSFQLTRNWVLLALGDREQARKGIDQGLAAEATAELLLQDGLLKFSQKDYPAGRAALQAALDRDPDELRALAALAESFLAQNQPAAALQAAQRHASRNPNSARAQLFLGQLASRVGSPQQARRAFAIARAVDPDYADAAVALADLEASEGNLELARNILQPVVSRHPRNLTARLLLGWIEESTGRHLAAIEHYRQALDLDPVNVVALNNLAFRFAAQRSDLAEALKFAQQAKELDPDSADVDDTLGWILYLNGQYRTALRHLEAAASKDGGNPLIRSHLATARQKLSERAAGF